MNNFSTLLVGDKQIYKIHIELLIYIKYLNNRVQVTKYSPNFRSEDDIAKKDAELLLLTAIHRGNENDLNERKSLKCTFDGCKAEFTKSKKLIIHERTHTGEVN